MRVTDLRARVPRIAKDGAQRVALGVAGLWGGRRTLPDFLILGTQRGGTTSLFAYLTRHPDVVSARLTKEVHYFDTRFERGTDWYRAFFPTTGARERHRRRTGRELVAGEATPYYLFHPLAPGRAADLVPGARLIAMLRDPVERAWSHYRHEVELGFETLSFADAIEREPARLAGEVERMMADPGYRSFAHQHHTYLARGRYAEQLAAWWERFPREQLLVIGSEGCFADPDAELRRAQGFLGVPSRGLPEYETYNATRSGGMDPGLRAELAARFAPDNARLYEMLGRSFDWTR